MNDDTVGIDGDCLVYMAAFAAQDDHVRACKHTLNRMIEGIMAATGCDNYCIFLSGKDNFRVKRATLQEYKANRKNNEKPVHYQAARDHLVTAHGGYVVDGIEADDALGIMATDPETLERGRFVIATIDKDLQMIPGEHYNFHKNHKDKGVFRVTEEEGNRFFATQLLTGDAVDNIPGLKKLTGKVATAKLKAGLNDFSNLGEMLEYVEGVYLDSLEATDKAGKPLPCPGADVIQMQAEIGDLLWIRRADQKCFDGSDEPTADGEPLL